MPRAAGPLPSTEAQTREQQIETLGCIVIDSGCSRNVCGEYWWKSYFASLPREEQQKLKVFEGRQKFQFGWDEILEAVKL